LDAAVVEGRGGEAGRGDGDSYREEVVRSEDGGHEDSRGEGYGDAGNESVCSESAGSESAASESICSERAGNETAGSGSAGNGAAGYADAGNGRTGRGGDEAENEIVVSASSIEEIVVNGRAARCRPAAGDPLDAVRVRSEIDPHSGQPRPAYLAIVPDGSEGHVAVPNAEQITGPDYWQRVGLGIDRFVFRGPSAGMPMCIGGRSGDDRFAGFRRVVDAAPYRGHRLRFTARVATGRARQVNFWLAAGTVWRDKPRRSERPRPNQLLNGGNSNGAPFGGDRGWTTVVLETGPIDADAHHVSYGFNLQGSGDVWVDRPRLEIVADRPGERAEELLVMIGPETG
jgi:hypothetical protein